MKNPIQALYDIKKKREFERRQVESEDVAVELLNEMFQERGDEYLEWLYECVCTVPTQSHTVLVSVNAGDSDGIVIESPFRERVGALGESSQRAFTEFYPYGPLYQNNYLVQQALQELLTEVSDDIVASFEYPEHMDVRQSSSALPELVEAYGGLVNIDSILSWATTGPADESKGFYSWHLLDSNGHSYRLSVDLGSYSFYEGGASGYATDGGVSYTRGIVVDLSVMTGNIIHYRTTLDIWGLWANMDDDSLLRMAIETFMDAGR